MVTNKQAEDRVHRIGQDAATFLIIDLVAPGTVEEKILDAIGAKGEMLEEITRDKETILRLIGG
jgi:SNF2 family DNA or RNA helicase